MDPLGAVTSSPRVERDRNREASFFQDLAKIFKVAIDNLLQDQEQAKEKCFNAALGAIEEGNWEAISKAQSYLYSLTNSHGQSLLVACVDRGLAKRVVEIRQKGMVEALSGGRHEYALHAAAKRGNLELIGLFFRQIPVSINSRDSAGKTALHLAIEYGHASAVDALLRNGASPKLVYRGLSALNWAVCCGAKDAVDAVVKNVPEAFEDVASEFGNVLHIAIQFKQTTVLEHLLTHYIQQTKTLLNQSNAAGRTPLMEAAYLGDIGAIFLLEKKGVNLEQRDPNSQTALHWAAHGLSEDAVQSLVYFGAKLKVIDTDGNKPRDLVKDKQDFASRAVSALLLNLEQQAAMTKRTPPQFSIRPPQNLVFKGGGPKGIAYLGALEVLEERDRLHELKRVVGTSAGAITAAVIAVGCRASEGREVLAATPISTWLDHPLTQSNLTEAMRENLTLSKMYSVLSDPLRLVNPLRWLKSLWHTTGVCQGEKFREWMEDLIKRKTGIPFCTFGDLHEEIRKGKSFRELHIYSIKIGENPELHHFYFGDTWKDLIISDAVRASMSIPGVFIPHILHFKGSQGERYPRRDLGSYVDGGMLNNLPIETFDEKGYVYNGLVRQEAQAPTFNRRTLGFSLYSASEKTPDNHDNATVLL